MFQGFFQKSKKTPKNSTMNSRYILTICTLLLLSGCKNKKDQVTDRNDYDNHLKLVENKTLQNAESNRDFWMAKLEKNPSQYPYLGKIASSYSQLFSATGNIEHLKEAENHLIKVNEFYQYKNPGSLMALAGNYISQHKFKDALEMLTKAELIGDELSNVQKMLFDVHLELGNKELAKIYLEKIENMSDFDYLIRLAKWSDHQGNLDAAIRYLEKAKTIAESSNQNDLKQWTYSNLADFYGHAGNIKASYDHYLKALQIDSNDAYSKKGIAWIVYSYEKNPDEALRILNTVTNTNQSPDYHLLKAEIYEFKRDIEAKDKQLKLYRAAVKNEAYGAMYNKYNVLLNTDENVNLDEAISIAKEEVAQRPTPQSYELLAWSYYKNGNVKKAIQIIEMHVIGHTFEPMAIYHSAMIYKGAGQIEKAEALKKELFESSYELGPIVAEKVNKI